MRGHIKIAKPIHAAAVVTRHLLLIALLLPAVRAVANEVLVSENFENFDPAKSPPGWKFKPADAFSIASDPAKGKGLRIIHKGDGESSVAIPLDAAKVCGHTVTFTAAAKCANSFTPIKEKYGYPQILIMRVDGAGKGMGVISGMKPDNPNWQNLRVATAIPADCVRVMAICRVVAVAADVTFDDLVIEVDTQPGAPAAAPPNAPPAVGAAPAGKQAAPAPQAPNAPPVPPPPAPANVPQIAGKTLDADGFTFNSDILALAKQAQKPGRTVSSIALAGPGFPNKEMSIQSPPRWKLLNSPKELSGATPYNLLSSLPPYIAKYKPEVVVLFGEAAPGSRKLAADEKYDWEDLARVCIRMGAIPVLAVPSSGAMPADNAPSDLRKEMLEAADTLHVPVLELKAPLDKRLYALLEQIDKNVFGRAVPNASAKGGNGGEE